jgi:hypothetical protein
MLKINILNTIKNNLTESWVSDYEWEKDFAACYFESWFYTAEDCFWSINNSAIEYSNMLYFVYYYDTSFITTVDLFNTYTYLYALYCLEHEPEIIDIIHNIRRIKKLHHQLPVILSRLVLSEHSLLIQAYLGHKF